MALGWLRWRAWAGVAGVAAAAVGVRPRLLAWQAWHFATSTLAGVARNTTCPHTTCHHTTSHHHTRGRELVHTTCPQPWHVWHWAIGLAPVARLGRSGRGGRRGCWRGRRGTLRHPPWFHVAGVVLGDIHLNSFHMAGVVLGDMDLHFVAGVARMALGWLRWRAWAGVAGVAAAAVGVAGVALCDIHLGFMWQAWYLVTSTFTLCGRRGRRGTYGTLRQPPWFHVAGVVLGGHPIPSSSRPCRGSDRGKNKRACGPTIHAYIHT